MLFPAYAHAYAAPRLVCDFSHRAPLVFADNGLPLAPVGCDLNALYANGVIHAIIIYTVIVGGILWRERD